MALDDTESLSIFTNMHSLLQPNDTRAPWPVSLQLPTISIFVEFQADLLTQRDPEMAVHPLVAQTYYVRRLCRKCCLKHSRVMFTRACTHRNPLRKKRPLSYRSPIITTYD
jgi:hypothetical protein